MAASDQILSIDIGAWSVKLGEFENASDGLTMKQFGYGEYSKLMTDDNRAELIKESLQKLIDERQVTSKKAYISLSSQLAFTRFVKLPPIDENEDRVKQIVEFEARQHVPFEMNEVIWDYQLIGTGEELDVMFVVIKNEIVDQITSAVESLGLKVVLVDVASSACYNASRANRIGDDSCAMVLSIGSRCSNLIFADGTHFFSRNIPIAGYAVTQQISKEFGIGIEEAEELKQRHGFVALGGAYEEPESEVAATISKIVRNVMTRLHGEVNRSINIYRSQQKGNKPVKLYLAGGSSTMAFTETFFQEKLRLDVEYLNPFQGIRLGTQIDRVTLAEKAHLFSEVIGIALRVSVCPVEISLVPEKLKEEAKFSGKKPFLYFSAVVAILIPLVFLGGSKSQRSNYEDQIKKVKKDVGDKSRQLGRIKKAIASKEAIKTKIEKLRKVELDKFRCVEVFEQIEKWAPNGFWVTNIEPITGDISKKAQAAVEGPSPEEIEGAGIRGRRGRILEARRKAVNTGSVVTGTDNQISGFIVKGYYVNSDENSTIDDVLFNYLSSLTLRQEKKIFQEDSKLTRILDFSDSETIENLSSFEIQLALY
ncbi:MAG: type IV pilus assembly protein PilM, partial [Lentisphaeraceae bacterium]|nr:type IV pilus assembly protein PilM [Lentisphaeraceae bacterium]